MRPPYDRAGGWLDLGLPGERGGSQTVTARAIYGALARLELEWVEVFRDGCIELDIPWTLVQPEELVGFVGVS